MSGERYPSSPNTASNSERRRRAVFPSPDLNLGFARSTQASRARSPTRFYTSSLEESSEENTSDTKDTETPLTDIAPADQPTKQSLEDKLEKINQPGNLNTETTSPPDTLQSRGEELIQKQSASTGEVIVSNQSDPKLPILPPKLPHRYEPSMPTAIRPFHGRKDGTEYPQEYIEDLEFAYEQDHLHKEPAASEPKATYLDRTYRVLFRSNLKDQANVWYGQQEIDIRSSWAKLKASFLAEYTTTEKDAEQRMFETRMRLHSLRQANDEHIAEYLKRAEELAIKMPGDLREVGMATLKGMKESIKKDQITYTCNSEANWAFPNVVKLVKAAYSKIGDTNPWDPDFKDATKMILNPGASTDELLRQALLQSTNTLPALLQGIGSMTTNQGRILSQSNQVQERFRDRNREQPTTRGRRDLSHIQCFKCDQWGHYATDCPTNSSNPSNQGPPQPASTKPATMSAFVDLESDDGSPTSPYVPARVLTICEDCTDSDEEPKASMAAAQDKGKVQASSSKQPSVLQRSKGIQKTGQPKPYKPPTLPPHILEQIETYNQQQGHQPETNENESNDEVMEDEESPPTQPANGSRRPLRDGQGRTNQAPQTRLTKTGKVQELVTSQPPKRPDPIRGMMGKIRLTSDRIFEKEVSFAIGELLDASDDLVKDMAYHMQRATPRYRVRKPAKPTEPVQPNQAGASGALVLAAAATPPPITTQAYEDDGQSQPVMIVAWIRNLRLMKVLLDGGSLVELMSRRVVRRMKPPPPIYNDGNLRVSLATDKIDVLTEYVKVPVNVEGVEAVIKAWLVDVDIYDLLLGLTWLRRVHCNPHYGLGVVTINGSDNVLRQVPAQLAPLDTKLPVVEFDEEEETADQACQHLLEQQENSLL